MIAEWRRLCGPSFGQRRSGTVDTGADSAHFTWQKGKVGARSISGRRQQGADAGRDAGDVVCGGHGNHGGHGADQRPFLRQDGAAEQGTPGTIGTGP